MFPHSLLWLSDVGTRLLQLLSIFVAYHDGANVWCCHREMGHPMVAAMLLPGQRVYDYCIVPSFQVTQLHCLSRRQRRDHHRSSQRSGGRPGQSHARAGPGVSARRSTPRFRNESARATRSLRAAGQHSQLIAQPRLKLPTGLTR
jgi:hypothetical protein